MNKKDRHRDISGTDAEICVAQFDAHGTANASFASEIFGHVCA